MKRWPIDRWYAANAAPFGVGSTAPALDVRVHHGGFKSIAIGPRSQLDALWVFPNGNLHEPYLVTRGNPLPWSNWRGPAIVLPYRRVYGEFSLGASAPFLGWERFQKIPGLNVTPTGFDPQVELVVHEEEDAPPAWCPQWRGPDIVRDQVVTLALELDGITTGALYQIPFYGRVIGTLMLDAGAGATGTTNVALWGGMNSENNDAAYPLWPTPGDPTPQLVDWTVNQTLALTIVPEHFDVLLLRITQGTAGPTTFRLHWDMRDD